MLVSLALGIGHCHCHCHWLDDILCLWLWWLSLPLALAQALDCTVVCMTSGRRYDCVRTIVDTLSLAFGIGHCRCHWLDATLSLMSLLYVRSHNVGRRPYSSACGLWRLWHCLCLWLWLCIWLSDFEFVWICLWICLLLWLLLWLCLWLCLTSTLSSEYRIQKVYKKYRYIINYFQSTK